MNIQPALPSMLSQPLPAPDRPTPPPVRSTGPDVYIRGRMADLSGALDAIPPIRPEAVALGRMLAKDPNYPGPVVLEHLAALFVADALR